MKQIYRILIADDEPHVRRSFEKVLKRHENRNELHGELLELEKTLFNEADKPEESFSYEITLCDQGEQAVHEVENALREDRPYAIAFLDVRMPPGIDGVETGEQIRAMDPDIEIVIVTAYSDTDVDEITRRIPPLDKLLFILKPFHPIEVIQFTAALATKWRHGRYLKSLHRQMEEELKFREDNIMVLYKRLQDDIQKRKRYEKQLRRHAIVFDTMDEAVLISDLEGRLLDANPSFRNVYGYEKDELLGKRLDQMHPNGEEVVETLLDNLRKNGFWIGELPIVRKNGRKGWIKLNIKEYHDHENELSGYISVNRDITENKRTFDILKQQKNLLEDVFTRIHDGIGIVNENEEYIFVNPAIARIYEVSVEELLGRNVMEFCNDEGKKTILDETIKRKDKQVTTYNLDITTAKGNKRVLRISAYPRFDTNGTYQGAFGVLQDITEQQRLREQFLQSQKMEAMGKLAGGIAHDFNNILTVINGSSELLRSKLPEDLQEDFLDDIVNASFQAKQLVDQLLLFSRKQSISPEILDINSTIMEMQTFLKRIIGVNVQIKMVLDSELGLVEVDSGQFKQILMNLAVNSRDAMPTGGMITIQTRNITIDETMQEAIHGSKVGDYISFTFDDTGVGIPKNVITHIFEPFFTTKASEHGTGLGLSTVFGIIQNHDGWVNVESEENKGTRFSVYLPRIDSDYVQEEQRRHLETELKGRGELILVVQENAAVREFTVQALQRNGYKVMSESNAQGARKCCEKHRDDIDIVLADVDLPDSTGMFLLSEIKSRKPEMKMILTSGYIGDNEKQVLIDNLHVPLLNKPYTVHELLVAIKHGRSAEYDLTEYCELFEICEFLKNMPVSQEYLNEGWKRMFCRTLAKSERCKRKRYFFETGKQPEKHMTPTGHIIKPE